MTCPRSIYYPRNGIFKPWILLQAITCASPRVLYLSEPPLLKKYDKFLQRITIPGQRATWVAVPYPPGAYGSGGAQQATYSDGSPAAGMPSDFDRRWRHEPATDPAGRGSHCQASRWTSGWGRLEDAWPSPNRWPCHARVTNMSQN